MGYKERCFQRIYIFLDHLGFFNVHLNSNTRAHLPFTHVIMWQARRGIKPTTSCWKAESRRHWATPAGRITFAEKCWNANDFFPGISSSSSWCTSRCAAGFFISISSSGAKAQALSLWRFIKWMYILKSFTTILVSWQGSYHTKVVQRQDEFTTMI